MIFIDVGTEHRKMSKLVAAVVVVISGLSKCKDIPVIPPTVNKIIKKKKTIKNHIPWKKRHGRNGRVSVRCSAIRVRILAASPTRLLTFTKLQLRPPEAKTL